MLWRHTPWAGGIGMCLFTTALMVVANPAFAEEETIGSDEYRISCASCHGVGGRGNGKLAKFLTPKPSDLTVLAKNNDGQYPFLDIFRMIDGRADVEAHGDRAMPVWGNRYRKEAAGEYGPCGAEKIVNGRILELVYYIQTIQQ